MCTVVCFLIQEGCLFRFIKIFKTYWHECLVKAHAQYDTLTSLGTRNKTKQKYSSYSFILLLYFLCNEYISKSSAHICEGMVKFSAVWNYSFKNPGK